MGELDCVSKLWPQSMANKEVAGEGVNLKVRRRQKNLGSRVGKQSSRVEGPKTKGQLFYAGAAQQVNALLEVKANGTHAAAGHADLVWVVQRVDRTEN